MQKLPRYVTKEEFEKIFIAETNKKYKLAYLLGFEAGLRISEIVGLNDRQGCIIVPPLKAEAVDNVSIRVLSGKGQKDRIVPRPRRMNNAAIKLLPLKMSRRALQYRIKKLGLEVINKKITFHSLRHGFASRLVEQGRPLHEIQMLLGHSRLDTTGIYLHANPKQAVEAARDAF